MKRLINNLFVLAMMWLSAVVYAKPSVLFNIAQSGVPMAAEVNLCLNGKGPLSCQRAHVAAQNLAITAAGNHAYSTAGIKVLTPGYAVTGCTRYSKTGYCLFAVNGQTSTAITLNNTSTPKYAYVSDYTTSRVLYCSLNVDGSFNLCNPTQTITSFNYPNYITFAVVNGITYAYVGDASARHLYQCSLNQDGSFNSCEPTPSSTSWEPTDAAFGTVNGTQYAYVTDVEFREVNQCTLNSDGSFNVCQPALSPSPSWEPVKITVATVKGTQYAYVSDVNSRNVYQCTLNANGSFNSCQPALLSPPSWVPYGVTFTTVNGVEYAYVSNPNDYNEGGHVYQCTLNNNGSFNSCQITPLSSPNWIPSDVAFATVNGIQYAYVTDTDEAGGGPTSATGHVYQCTLNQDGSFNSCQVTPSPSPSWLPLDVAFLY